MYHLYDFSGMNPDALCKGCGLPTSLVRFNDREVYWHAHCWKVNRRAVFEKLLEVHTQPEAVP